MPINSDASRLAKILKIIKEQLHISYVDYGATPGAIKKKEIKRRATHKESFYAKKSRTLIASGDPSGALLTLKRGIREHPKSTTLLTLQQKICRRVGAHSASLQAARKLAAINPQSDEYQWQIIEALTAAGRHHHALRLLSKWSLAHGGSRAFLILEHYLLAVGGQTTMAEGRQPYTAKNGLSRREIIAFHKSQNYLQTIIPERLRVSARETHIPNNEIGPQAIPTGKQYLLISGLGRSGTTATGNVLSTSNEIAVYTELYSPWRVDGYSAEDFKKENILKQLERHKHRDRNAKVLSQRHDQALFVCDKAPNSQFTAEASIANMPPGRLTYIHITRRLFDVCLSAHARSINNADTGWPREMGIEFCIQMHNATCKKFILMAADHASAFQSFAFLDYETFFGFPEGPFQLFEQLKIDLSREEKRRLEKKSARSKLLLEKARNRRPNAELENRICAAIQKGLDHESHARFCELTGMPGKIFPRLSAHAEKG